MKPRLNPPAVRVLTWLLCLALSMAGMFFAWDFIDGIAEDELEARFESEPAEGFDHWYRRELLNGWWAITLIMGPFVILMVFLLRSALHWFQRSR
jgi:hypothetical protein